MVGKSAGNSSAQIKAVATVLVYSLYFSLVFRYALAVKEKSNATFTKDVFDEAVKVNFY